MTILTRVLSFCTFCALYAEVLGIAGNLRSPRAAGEPVLSALSKDSEEDANESNLGEGMRFVVARYDNSPDLRSDLDQLGMVENVEGSGQCCSACTTKYPTTTIFNMFKSHPVRGTCSCLRQVSKKPVRVYRPRSPTKESTIGVCGTQNFEVDGALGPGMDFDVASVNFLDYIDENTNSFLEPIQDSSMCCRRCWASKPETQLFLYTDEWKGCTCYETRPGRRPITYADEYFAGGCGPLQVGTMAPITSPGENLSPLRESAIPPSDPLPPGPSRPMFSKPPMTPLEGNLPPQGQPVIASSDATLPQPNKPRISGSPQVDTKIPMTTSQGKLSAQGAPLTPPSESVQPQPTQTKLSGRPQVNTMVPSTPSDGVNPNSKQPKPSGLPQVQKITPKTTSGGCNGGAHGIKCCDKGFTPGDNSATEEIFIQADKYESNCLKTCKSLYPNSRGITEHLKQSYKSGNGKNKKKCWCNFGEPKLDPLNKEYQTCVFRK